MATEAIIGIALIASMLFVVFLGVPIAFALGALAIIWALVVLDPSFLYTIPINFYSTATHDILLALPFFVLMANALRHSGLGEEAYGAVHKLVGGLRGGLAIGTIAVCAALAACTGLTAPAILSIGLIAIPAMLSRGYNKHIVLGSVAAGGSLGTLIPPSVPIIIYATLAGESVGKLFMGAFLPGFLLASLYILYIGIRAALNPALCPSAPREGRAISLREKVVAVVSLLPIALLVGMVLGSIYTGTATPTEAGAVGAATVLLIALLKRKLNWQIFKEILYHTGRLTAFGFWIVIGANCFTSIFSATGAGNYIVSYVLGIQANRWWILIGMNLTWFVLGCVIDEFAIILLCTPIYLPIIKTLGFNPLWFGIIFMVNIQMAYLTPPYGFALFFMKSIMPKELTMGDLYRAVVPFVGLQALGLSICMYFPSIILWLPSTMK